MANDPYAELGVARDATPEAIKLAYRKLARKHHPDLNPGKPEAEARFKAVSGANDLLSDPERRARYDVLYQQRRQDQWRLVSAGGRAENDFEMEQVFRLTVLEILYTKRRLEPDDAGVVSRDLEKLTGRPREHLEFTIWFLAQKQLVTRDDASRLFLTAEGAEYLEQHYRTTLQQKRLQP